jgi:TRAP-type mannitol/chloroaromatic compound transport system permease small subunit
MQAGHGTEQKSRLQLLDTIQTVKQALDRILLGTGYIAGGLFFLLAFFVTYDALARKWGSIFGLPTTRVTDEISGYMLVLAATWGFAYTLRTDAHVRIDVLLPYMPKWLRASMDFLTLTLTAFLSWIFSWKIWMLMLDSLRSGMRSSTYLLAPLWVPQLILWVGFTLLAVTALVMAVMDILEFTMLRRHHGGLTEHAAEPGLESVADPPAPGKPGGTRSDAV